jgi:hypothetical protein
MSHHHAVVAALHSYLYGDGDITSLETLSSPITHWLDSASQDLPDSSRTIASDATGQGRRKDASAATPLAERTLVHR